MRPIIIGAGRGSRLGHQTDEVPKTLVPVMGRPMLEWILDALAEAGFSRRDVIFICGYKADVIKARYPEFTYVENRDWASNNILLSLMCAREHHREGFVSTYADIVYRGDYVKGVLAAEGDVALGCDTAWRRRYVSRSQHPETDAEKMRGQAGRVLELSRRIASEAATGEFVGVARFSADGARALGEAFDEARAQFAGREFHEGRSFEKAYLIDLLQWMLARGAAMSHADVPGGYMEIDTLEDLAMAASWWEGGER